MKLAFSHIENPFLSPLKSHTWAPTGKKTAVAGVQSTLIPNSPAPKNISKIKLQTSTSNF